MVTHGSLQQEVFLVTGAAGFIGARLARRLAAECPHVHIILREGSDRWRLLDIMSKLTVHTGDLTDARFVSSVVQEIRPTVIYHMAAHGAYPTQTDAGRILTTNIMGTLNLLQAVKDLPLKLFLSAGSSSEYGFKDTPMRESDALEPNSFYAVAKAAQALLCQYASGLYAKPVVTFRFFSVYGPYEEPTRLVPVLLRSCLDNRDFLMTDPRTARDFIFVDDVVSLCLNIETLRQHGGAIFNIGTGKQTSLEEIVACALRVTGSKAKPVWGGMKDRIWDTRVWVGDVAKARQLLHWSARTSLEEGLSKTAAWWKGQ